MGGRPPTFAGRGSKTQRRVLKFCQHIFGAIDHPMLVGDLAQPKSCFIGGDTLTNAMCMNVGGRYGERDRRGGKLFLLILRDWAKRGAC